MNMPKLLVTTDNSRVDRALMALVESFEACFPGRITSYYLHGSQSDRTAIETSDLDVDVVIRDRFRNPDEQETFYDHARPLQMNTSLELDIEVTDEATLARGAEPNVKLGSVLLFGEDIRSSIPLISIEEWGSERMHRGYFLLMTVFKREPPARYPLTFPNLQDEFFGYVNRFVTDSCGAQIPTTRNLIRVAGWLATALIAHEAGVYVINKSECRRLYRCHFDDEWADLLDDIHNYCRRAWKYEIPTESESRRRLRSMCARFLDFESHFLTRYKPFLAEELGRAADDGESRAAWLMNTVPFDDTGVPRL